MTRISRNTKRRGKQAGYGLLMAIFLVATILIFAAASAPNLLTQGKREREEEMVWRGQQYERAIGMYYRKFGRYPTKVDDLTKQTNGLRFLRQAYPDPMNKEDGAWRFIYVGPNGQLIGSLRSTSLMQSVMSTPALPGSSSQGSGLGSGLAAAIGSILGGGSQAAPGPGGATTGPGSSLTGALAGPGSGSTGAPGVGQTGQQTSDASTPDSLESQPQPLGGTVIGGNIIGVGSKIKQSSFLIYQGGDTYQKWEFIWNPMQQVALPGGQQPVNPNAPAAPQAPGSATPGSLPTGTAPPGSQPPADTTPPPGQQGTPPAPVM